MGKPDVPESPPQGAGTGYEQEERAYADWVHRFVARLGEALPAHVMTRVMPIATYWALHSRHMAPEDAADAAALWSRIEPEAFLPGADDAGADEPAADDDAPSPLSPGNLHYLAGIEQYICTTTARIAQQEARIARLASKGRDVREAVALLDCLNSTLYVLGEARATALRRWGDPPQEAPLRTVGP